MWVSGRIIDGPKEALDRMFYRVKLDNGECRWGPSHQFRSAQLHYSSSAMACNSTPKNFWGFFFDLWVMARNSR